eukprot:m.3214 g.3214  ORF g.3214 m.3214 type:complete len:50 (+) comp3850_c0_seq1:62-211(+)
MPVGLFGDCARADIGQETKVQLLPCMFLRLSGPPSCASSYLASTPCLQC